MAGARIQLKRALATQWTASSIVLLSGEIGYETDTDKFKIGNGSSLWTSLPYFNGNLSGSNLNDLADVTITSAANGDFLRWNGTAWINDAVNLSTDTVGDYVGSLVAGTGVTLSNNSGEGATPTVAIGQSVATTDSPTFAGLTINGADIVIEGATANEFETTLSIVDPTTDRTITFQDATGTVVLRDSTDTLTNKTLTSPKLNEDVVLSATATELNILDGATLTTTELNYVDGVTSAIQTQMDLKSPLESPTFTGTVTVPDNTIALGTKTTGDYVATITGGTGVSSTAATTGEGTTHTLSIGQSVATTDSPTFAGLTVNGASVVFEGVTTNDFETTLSVADPTADRTITFPDANGTVALSGTIALGTDTTGDYVASLVAGTGISVANNSGEGATPTVSLNASLDNLTDAVITSPLEYETLVYNGTNWVNQYASTATYVRNAEATTLTTGTVVYLFGATGDHAAVKRADNDSDATSSKTVGIVASPIATSENGPVVTRGYVDGINLSTGYASGDVLWLGEDGGFTKTKPTAPEHLVFVGVVVRASVNGIVYVATQNGYELDELHDVSIVDKTSGDFLKYNGTLWVNDQINLGTDTTGNYMSDVSVQNGLTVSHTPGEGSTATVGVDNALMTNYLLDGAAGNSYGLIGTSTYLDVKNTNGYNKEIELDIAAVKTQLNTDGYLTESSTSTLTNKTLTSPKINENVALTATATELNILDGATLSTTELNYVDGVTSAIQTQIDTKAPIASPAFTGTVTLPADPSSALHAATKQYVDNVVSGVNFHESVAAATVGNLAGTYNNGTSGVGATITKASNGAIGTIDGATVVVGSRILIKDQTDPKENGIYTVTTVGSGSAPWVVTRAADADNNPAGEMANGDFCFVIGGSTNAGYGYINSSTADPIVIGTDDVTYVVFNAAQIVVGGAGLSFTGNTLDVGTASTSRIVVNADNIDLASGVITSTGTYNSVTVDTYGRVTAGTNPTTLSGYGITDAAPINNASFTGTFSAPTGTITSTMIADATIVNADISTTAAIAHSKLADATAGQVLLGTTTTGVVTATTISGDVTITGAGVTAIGSGKVTSSMILDGTIVDGDINASAGIALSKLATSTAGNIIVYNSAGVPTAVAESGDISISDTGVTAIGAGKVTSTMILDGTIVNGDINTSAAIALSKLASGTSAQVIVADGSGVPTYVTLSGDVTISNTGVATIQANSVALGTDTTGSYVTSLVAGTGITLSNNSGESATPTVAVTANTYDAYGSARNLEIKFLMEVM